MANTSSPYLELLNSLQNFQDEKGQSYPRIAQLVPDEDSICDIDLNARRVALPSDKYAKTVDAVFHPRKEYYHKIVDNEKVEYVPFKAKEGAKVSEHDQNVYERYTGFLSVQYEHDAEIIYLRCPRYWQHMDLATTVCVIEFVNAHGDAGIYWVPFYDTSHSVLQPGGRDEPMLIIPWAISGLVTAYEGDVTFTVHFYKLTGSGTSYHFNMKMQPATGKILHGLDFSDIADLTILDNHPDIVQQIYQTLSSGLEQVAIYWRDAD